MPELQPANASVTAIPEKNLGHGDAHYEVGYHEAFHGSMLAADDLYEARAQLAAEIYLTAAERTQRVFEYGCGIGQNIAALPNAAGWDISPDAVAAARAHGVRVYDALEDAPEGAWDVVICRHVLEHLETPLAALQSMRRLLAPKGKVVLIIPKEWHWREPLRPDYTQHIYCWNFRSINNLMFRAGLRPTYNGYHYPLGWHAFMPIRRRFGHAAYAALSRAGGILRRNGEIIVHAVLGDATPAPTR